MSTKSLIARCAVAMLALAMCIPAMAADKTVLLSLSKQSEPFMALMARAATEEAAKLGVELLIQDGRGDSEIQANAIENALYRGSVDGIVVAPNNAYALAPALSQAIKKGIPVVTVDRKVYDISTPVPHVGIDNVAGGRILADWVVRTFPNGARILHLTGQSGSSSAIERARGVREGLATAEGAYRIVAELSANWSRVEAQMVTEGRLAVLKSPPEVIVADNDDMAMGAVAALRLAGLGERNIPVIGFDAMPFAIEALRDGRISATVDQRGAEQIRAALQELVAHLREGRPMRSVTVEPVLVSNVQSGGIKP